MESGADRAVTASRAGAATRVEVDNCVAESVAPLFASMPVAPTAKLRVPAPVPFSVRSQVKVALWPAARSTPEAQAAGTPLTAPTTGTLVTGVVPIRTDAPPIGVMTGSVA